jgi:hypothetical protein
MQRFQLTLFTDKNQSIDIEEIRKKYNPLQHELIDSHITLCREDELLDLNQLKINLQNLKFKPLKLQFGSALRFSDGKGVYMPVSDEVEWFHTLRKSILKGIIDYPREHEPHLTLMHPRNSTCTDKIFQEIKDFSLPTYLIFQKISLIQQLNGERWSIIEELDLNSNR